MGVADRGRHGGHGGWAAAARGVGGCKGRAGAHVLLAQGYQEGAVGQANGSVSARMTCLQP